MIAPESRTGTPPVVEFRRMRVYQPTQTPESKLTSFVSSRPLALGAAALVVGLLVGWLLKRR